MPTSAAAERVWVLPDEPLPVRLMSTVWADADGLHDDLRTTADVNAWLDAIGVDRAGAHATERELATARALRDAVRLLASYVTADARPGGPAAATADVAAAAIDQVNATAAELPAPRLALRDGRLGLGVPGGPVSGDDRARAGRGAGGRAAGRGGRRPTARLLCARLRALLRQDPSATRMVLGRLRQPSPRRPPLPAGSGPPGGRLADPVTATALPGRGCRRAGGAARWRRRG